MLRGKDNALSRSTGAEETKFLGSLEEEEEEEEEEEI
jgi:hypothetical protein